MHASAVDVGRVEVMAMLGIFGTLWSALLVGSLEGRALVDAPWTWKVTHSEMREKSLPCRLRGIDQLVLLAWMTCTRVSKDVPAGIP